MSEGRSASDQRRADAPSAPHDRERRLRVVFDSMDLGMCVTTLDGAFLEVNRAFCDLLGYGEAELMALDLATVTHPADLPLLLRNMQSWADEQAGPANFEGRLVHRMGTTVGVVITASLVREASGEPATIIVQIRDTSAQRAGDPGRIVDTASDILNAMNEVALVLSRDLTILAASPGLVARVGKPLPQLIGTPAASHLPPDLAASRGARMAEVLGTCQPAHFEDHNGGRVFANSLYPVLDPAGQVSRIAVFCRDITELRNAEREAREQSHLLDSILAASPVGIALIRDRVPIWANEAMAAMCGQSLAEHLRTAPRSLYADEAEYRRIGHLLYDSPLRAGTPQVETTWVRGDGSSVQVLLQVNPLDSDNADETYIVTASDLTDRKQVALALQQSEARFRTAFEDAPIGLSLTAVDGTLLKVNRALCIMLGRTEHELIGGNMAAVTHPDDVEITRRVMRDLVASGGNTVRFGKRFVHTDGHVVHAELSSFLLRDSAGRPQHFITHLLDVTERNRAEAALQESERRFREMTDLLPDIVFELDRDFRVTYINQAATDVLGYTPADLDAGVGMADVLDAAALPRTAEHLLTIVAGEAPSIGAYDIKRKDGGTLPMEVHSIGIVQPDGELVGYRGVMRDITDRKRAEAERLAALGQLAAGVAHDFGNLLSIMRGWARWVQDHPSEGGEQLPRVVLEATARGIKLTDGLLDLSRERHPLAQLIRIESVVEAVLLVTGRQLAQANVQVVRQYGPDGRPAAVDADQIERVFLNLIVNACQAMSNGGTLTVATQYVTSGSAAAEVVVTISDTGSGIAPDHLPHIFQSFFTTKRQPGGAGLRGNGLGLVVAQRIVAEHEGTISVQSEVGVGTTFEVRLPLAANALAPLSAAPD